MQEADVLWYIVNISLVGTDQRVLERNVDGSIAVLHVEHDSVAARLAPPANNLYALIASGHQPGEIDCADLEILGHHDRLFNDRSVENPRNGQLLRGFQKSAVYFGICAADCLGKL